MKRLFGSFALLVIVSSCVPFNTAMKSNNPNIYRYNASIKTMYVHKNVTEEDIRGGECRKTELYLFFGKEYFAFKTDDNKEYLELYNCKRLEHKDEVYYSAVNKYGVKYNFSMYRHDYGFLIIVCPVRNQPFSRADKAFVLSTSDICNF